jgi:hypothetical protein
VIELPRTYEYLKSRVNLKVVPYGDTSFQYFIYRLSLVNNFAFGECYDARNLKQNEIGNHFTVDTRLMTLNMGHRICNRLHVLRRESYNFPAFSHLSTNSLANIMRKT